MQRPARNLLWCCALLLSAAGQPLKDNSDSATPAVAPPPACTCAQARLTNGWCNKCAVGYVAGVPIKGPIFYEFIDAHGHEVDGPLPCEGCRAAQQEDGLCPTCKCGFVDKKLYFTRLTWSLARGTFTDVEKITCPACRKNTETTGWCDQCGLGMTGNVAFKDRQKYLEAKAEYEKLLEAVKVGEQCEWCACAMFGAKPCQVHKEPAGNPAGHPPPKP